MKVKKLAPYKGHGETIVCNEFGLVCTQTTKFH